MAKEAEDLKQKVDMSPHSKGLALIVGCESGQDNEKKRYPFLHGVKTDVDLMEETFRDTLKYCTWCIMNPTINGLAAALRAVAFYPKYPSSYRRFVFVFAGHGIHEKILLDDGFVRIIDDIIALLEAKNAPLLATMPKLFFIDACRGPLSDSGITVASRGGDAVPPIKVPEKGNMLIAYSTLPFYKAIEVSSGPSSAWGLWLKTLSSELRTSKDSINDILLTVRIKVLEECKTLPTHQVSQSDDTLLEKVCFLKEAESQWEVEAMDTNDTLPVTASVEGTPPLSLNNSHIPTGSALRNEQRGLATTQLVPGPATTQLNTILSASKLKVDEKYVEDAANGVPRYKCTLKCVYGMEESGYHPTRESSTEEAAQKLLPKVRSLASRGGAAAQQVSAVKQLEDHFKKERKEVKYDTRRTPNKRYLSHAFVPGVGRVEGKEEKSEERAKDSAAAEALKKLKLA